MKKINEIMFDVGTWLIEMSGAQRQFMPAIDEEVLRAAALGAVKSNTLMVSGEYKRHAVLADLIKQFPDQEKSVLSMAIELAIWGMK